MARNTATTPQAPRSSTRYGSQAATAHKSTVTLDDDLYARWKASRLPLAEVVRRGLDGTGDTARHAAAETRLAGVEARLAAAEGRLAHALRTYPADDGTADDQDQDAAGTILADWPPTLEQIEQRREAQYRLKAAEWHRALLRHVQPDGNGLRFVTANDAAGALRCTGGTARDRLHVLTSLGLAEFLDDSEAPHRWSVREQDASVSAQ